MCIRDSRNDNRVHVVNRVDVASGHGWHPGFVAYLIRERRLEHAPVGWMCAGIGLAGRYIAEIGAGLP